MFIILVSFYVLHVSRHNIVIYHAMYFGTVFTCCLYYIIVFCFVYFEINPFVPANC